VTTVPVPDAHGSTPPGCSLYAIPARDGRSAVVFRRGPSKRVLVLRWWLDDDRIEQGHWFSGRIYEKRCDLSPEGDLLVYFAARYRSKLPTWTAISRTPYLTALVLWSCWLDGGGHFGSSRDVCLDVCLAPRLRGPPQKSVAGVLNEYPTDELAEHINAFARKEPERWFDPEVERMVRDGWTCVAAGLETDYNERFQRVETRFRGPEILERVCPPLTRRSAELVVRRTLTQENYVVETVYALTGRGSSTFRPLPDVSWCDWHTNGDLLFAQGGSLYRIAHQQLLQPTTAPLEGARLVADLHYLRWENRPPPEWATRWPGEPEEVSK